MGYTASDTIERIKLKAWTSTSSALSDGQLLELLNDSMRSFLVPFLKEVRDEWFVSGSESVQPDANGKIPMPNSVASTIRTIWWSNNGVYVPLTRVEPERMPAYINGNSTNNQPYGFVLEGYNIQILPNNVGSVTVRIDFMERPAEMVLEEDAGLISSHVGLALTLSSVPLAWQETAPTTVDLISNVSPFSAVASSVSVVSLVGDVLTLTGIDSADIEDGFWVSDVGTSPYPNVPIEFHPLLQQDVITTLFTGLGDKRLQGAQQRQVKMESELRRTMAPRTQGNARPIVNPNAPGMRIGRGWGWWY